MRITIETTDNGAVVKWREEGSYMLSFKFDEDDQNDLVRLHYTINELVNGYGGKYDKQRVEIKVVHGSGYECKDNKCTICHNK